MIEIVWGILLLALAIASISDLRTREVPDWLSYSLILLGLAVNIFRSLVAADFHPALFSLAGLGVFALIGYGMYFTGQWGGGDSKILMGVGAVLGLPLSTQFPFFSVASSIVGFWMNMLIAGLVYGLIWSVCLAIIHRRDFLPAFLGLLARHRLLRRLLLAACAVMLAVSIMFDDSVLRLGMAVIVVASILCYYIWLFSKAVEQSSMLKLVSAAQLTEGDWIVNDIFFKGKRICGPRDLGISKEQIAQLVSLEKRGAVKKVLIKEGIPFIPSFFVAGLLTFSFGNLILAFFQLI